jgi:putative flippase GtrA
MIRQQFMLYVIIGLLLNAALYGTYLLLTHTWMGSRVAMSVTYCAGVLIGFALNREITFRYRGTDAGAMPRYVVSYAAGYVVDYLGLWLLVDYAGVAHELAQGGLSVAIALMLFALQRYWVFSPSPSRESPVEFRP